MKPPGAIIREAGQNDLDAILLLYSDMHENPVVSEAKLLEKIWSEIVSDERLHLFILESDDVPAATCILDIVPNLTWGAKPYGLIENVVTKKEFRRLGLGSKLLEYALEFAWERNCYKVMLLTGRKEEVIRDFYEKTGFRKDLKTGFVALNPEYRDLLSHP